MRFSDLKHQMTFQISPPCKRRIGLKDNSSFFTVSFQFRMVKKRMKFYLIFDFALSDEEMAAITAMDAQQRVAGVPDDMMPYIL